MQNINALRFAIVGLISSSCCISNAVAREGVEVGAGITYYESVNGDSQWTEVDSESGFKGIIGYRFDTPWSIEFNMASIDGQYSDGMGGAEMDAEYTHRYVDILYHFNSGETIEPYIAFGLGEYEADQDVGGARVESKPFDFGIGLKYYLANNFIIRPDFHYMDGKDEGIENKYLSLTVSYLFGHSRISVAKNDEPKKVSGPLDQDKDGVEDGRDQCPMTPQGIGVDARGCPLDSDGDGVYDYQDKCPNTVAKLKVDSSGCPISLTETVSIDLKINFDSNSDVVKPEYLSEIRRVAEFMEQYANTSVVIEGHTDTTGSASYNKALSQRRASAVAKMLIEKMNVEQSRVRAIGYGEEQPIADDSTQEGRLANRRVVAKISTKLEKLQER